MTSKHSFLLLQAKLTNYTVNAVTQGPEALATTRVSLTQKGRETDLITSAQVGNQFLCIIQLYRVIDKGSVRDGGVLKLWLLFSSIRG